MRYGRFLNRPYFNTGMTRQDRRTQFAPTAQGFTFAPVGEAISLPQTSPSVLCCRGRLTESPLPLTRQGGRIRKIYGIPPSPPLGKGGFCCDECVKLSPCEGKPWGVYHVLTQFVNRVPSQGFGGSKPPPYGVRFICLPVGTPLPGRPEKVAFGTMSPGEATGLIRGCIHSLSLGLCRSSSLGEGALGTCFYF